MFASMHFHKVSSSASNNATPMKTAILRGLFTSREGINDKIFARTAVAGNRVSTTASSMRSILHYCISTSASRPKRVVCTYNVRTPYGRYNYLTQRSCLLPRQYILPQGQLKGSPASIAQVPAYLRSAGSAAPPASASRSQARRAGHCD